MGIVLSPPMIGKDVRARRALISYAIIVGDGVVMACYCCSMRPL